MRIVTYVDLGNGTSLPGGKGPQTRADAIKYAKEFAAREIEGWQKVLAKPDNEFGVRIVQERGDGDERLLEELHPDDHQ